MPHADALSHGGHLEQQAPGRLVLLLLGAAGDLLDSDTGRADRRSGRVATRNQPHQVAVAGSGRRQQHQVVDLLSPVCARDVELATQNRLHPRLAAELPMTNCAEHVGVIGQRHGAHPQPSGLGPELRELALKIHLGSKDAKDEWDKLEKKWDELVAQGKPVADAVGETARNVGSAAELAAEEIKKGYERIKKLLGSELIPGRDQGAHSAQPRGKQLPARSSRGVPSEASP